MKRTRAQIAAALVAPLLAIPAFAAPAPTKGFGVCVPNSQRGGREVGCFIVAEQKLGRIGSAPVYWHLTQFASRQAAEAARGRKETVVEAYGKAWLMSIAGRDWRAPDGKHVAAIGPLPVKAGTAYSALYMDASMTPGMKSAIHRHSGVEAWYTITGETCLETPEGMRVGRAGEAPVIIPEGLPMELTATGSALRTSLVLILHATARGPTIPEKRWKPKGLCRP